VLLDLFTNETRVVKSPGTAGTYKRVVRQFLKYLESKDISVESVTADHLQQYVIDLVDAKKSPSYVRLVGAVVTIYLNWLVERGELSGPYKCPKLPSIPVNNPKSIHEDILVAYAQAARLVPEPYSTVLLLLPLSGLRSAEICAMELTSLKVTGKWVIITVLGKGRKTREIPLLKSANSILKKYLTGWRAKVTSKWLFPMTDDMAKPCSTRSVRKWLQRVGSTVGLKISPHTLRRTYMTMLHRHGVNSRTLANLAGHSDEKTTFDHYVTRDSADLCRALEDIDIRI
jgi:site-specific recombinase XerD